MNILSNIRRKPTAWSTFVHAKCIIFFSRSVHTVHRYGQQPPFCWLSSLYRLTCPQHWLLRIEIITQFKRRGKKRGGRGEGMWTYYPKVLFESGKLSWKLVLSLWPKAEQNESLPQEERIYSFYQVLQITIVCFISSHCMDQKRYTTNVNILLY